MVSRRIAEALLRLAARRWPARLRADLYREWSAELHALGSGRTAQMLSYAASLAVSRPVRDPIDVHAAADALWRAIRLIVLAPLAAIILFVAAFVSLSLLPLGDGAQMWLPLVASVGSATLLARSGRLWAPRDVGIGLLVPALTVPGFVFSNLIYMTPSGISSRLALQLPAYVVVFGGFAVLLYAVDRLADAGRRRAAWWAGGAGAFVLADIAVTIPVLLSAETDAPVISAPLWLFIAFVGSPTGGAPISGPVEFEPFIYTLTTGLALGVVLSRKVKQDTRAYP